jgi:methylmalonyl-CoA mutase C-terminal domain/subunit
MVVRAAIQEDVDVIGVSILSGAHNTVFRRILELLEAEGVKDILLTGGGIIPDEDAHNLNALGVARLFPPGANTTEIADYIREWVSKNRSF